MKPLSNTAWLGFPVIESVFILLPPFAALAAIICWPEIFQSAGNPMSDAWWVLLILLIDVGHVYSTLFRTYFDPVARRQHAEKLWLIPFLCFTGSLLLYSWDELIFWRVMAYAAVFHFIRQQYGFFRVYARKESAATYTRWVEMIAIYAATLYPVLYWHLSDDRAFNWFVEQDFFHVPGRSWFLPVLRVLYGIVLVLYCIEVIRAYHRTKIINIPKQLIFTGTAISWYAGIVYFNADMSFTLLNVVSHGIPYIALVWIYGKRQQTNKSGSFLRLIFSNYGWPLFLLIIFGFAFLEEGCWDLTVWKEHGAVFSWFSSLRGNLSKPLLLLLVSLLAVPQLTHYFLDGFIWRVKKNDFKWTENQP